MHRVETNWNLRRSTKNFIMDNQELLILAIQKLHPYLAIQPDTKIIGNATIDKFPCNGFKIYIKPNDSGMFIFYYSQFQFFDKEGLQIYFKNNLKYPNASFISNVSQLYVYPRNLDDLKFCVDVFNYTQETIKKIIGEISNFVQTKKFLA